MHKHVGKHNNKKIVLLFREVPDEPHMCLIIYSDLLPRLIHDEVMKVLESPVGQQAKDFSDALFRTIMADGRNALEALHRDGFIKKVPTNQVLITPTTNSSVRLDELNNILNEMAKGEEAVRKLADLDANKGMSGKRRNQVEERELGVPNASRTAQLPEPTMSAEAGILTDADLARDRINQANTMKANAEQLLREAERLIAEAAELDPTLKKNARSTKKKVAVKAQKD